MVKNIPPSPPVRIASTSMPCGSTVTSPPPTSETSRDWSSIASPTESSTIMTPTPMEKPSRRKSERAFLTRRWRKARVPIMTGPEPVLGHDPTVQHVDHAASLRGQALVMGHDEQGGAVLIEPAKEVEDLATGGGVELTGRLVGEQDRRPVGERAGDRHPLHLSTGELGGTVPLAVTEPDVLQQLPRPRPPPGAGTPASAIGSSTFSRAVSTGRR